MISYASILSCFALYWSTVHAASNDTADVPYTITDLRAFSPTDREDSTNVTVILTVLDSDPRTNSSTVCAIQWPSSKPPPWNYVDCQDLTWGWYVSTFDSVQNFTVELSHSFAKPNASEDDLDLVTTFGSTTVNTTVLECNDATNGTSCKLAADKTILVPLSTGFDFEDDEELDAELEALLNGDLDDDPDADLDDDLDEDFDNGPLLDEEPLREEIGTQESSAELEENGQIEDMPSSATGTDNGAADLTQTDLTDLTDFRDPIQG